MVNKRKLVMIKGSQARYIVLSASVCNLGKSSYTFILLEATNMLENMPPCVHSPVHMLEVVFRLMFLHQEHLIRPVAVCSSHY